MKTEMGREMVKDFNAKVLAEIASAARTRAEILRCEARGVQQRDGLQAALALMGDAGRFTVMASNIEAVLGRDV